MYAELSMRRIFGMHSEVHPRCNLMLRPLDSKSDGFRTNQDAYHNVLMIAVIEFKSHPLA